MTSPNNASNSIASSNHVAVETRSTETERRSTRRMKPRSRSFTICPSLLQCRSLRWSIPKRQRLVEFFFDSLSTLLEWFVYGIGPLLILLALSIMLELSYTFFYILLPMIHHKYLHSPFQSIILFIHCTIVICILINILFNYTCCVLQRHTGKHYDQVIQEYAALADVTLPSTPQELANYRRDLIERLSQRMRQLEADTAETSPPRPKPRAWMLLGPYEWGYCSNSQQVKPPRAHYDHVTKSLVLNLDHYCPWMFNAIGYFNYRYFVNFLLFTMLGMIYGAFLLLEPFLLSKSSSYRQQSILEHQYHLKKHAATATQELLTRIRPMVPFRSERLFITLSFMLCVAVGIALVGLGGFHMYLISTGQTTIEFHARWSKGRRKGTSPYSRGTRLANWQQVYGTARGPSDAPIASWIQILGSLLWPHYELPHYLPVPIPGQCTRRKAAGSVAAETLPVVEAV